YPSNYVHAIVVNSIRDFGVHGVEPASWLYIDGCTNFGGNISVSVSSTSCSSEATGRSSGIAGMIVSAGRDPVAAGTLRRPLDPMRDGNVVVQGRVAADRASSYTYRAQIGYGVQPLETEWVDIVPFGATRTAPLDGVLATITPAQIAPPTAAQVARRQAEAADPSSK